MQEHLIDEAEASQALHRKTFLTVLCILTWVGCAVVIGLYGYAYISLNAMVRRWDGDLPDGIRWIIWNMFVGCAGSLVCAAGSIAMWNLRRWGFYVYAAGQIAPIATTVYVLLVNKALKYSSVSQLSLAALWIVVPIGFIILYALNLKYLRK